MFDFNQRRLNVNNRRTNILSLFVPMILTGLFAAPMAWAGGSISGEITAMSGVKSKKVSIDKDQGVCGKEATHPDVLVSNGKLQNVLVSVNGVKGGKKATPTEVTFDQKDCVFMPHMLVVPAGSTVNILNSDPITHNIHTFPIDNDPINKAQPKTLPKITTKVEFPETIKVKCDIHKKWMSAWWVVTEHPYHSVSDPKGQFKISDVPAGTYKLSAWHEKLGKQTQEVTVKDGQDTKVSFAFKPK